MKRKRNHSFNYHAVHKHIAEYNETRSVTEQGAKALRAAFNDALLRKAHREELTRGKRHEQ